MIETFEQTLAKLVPKQKGSLYEAAAHSLDGGKRLRPRLLLSLLKDFNIDLSHGLYPACALEMIHTYSLIHDDLPCMDDDAYRRNKPTLHVLYGEAHAVLTGDFLLTLAFETLSKAPHLDADQRISLIQIVSQQAGLNGMIGGQVEDIEGNQKDTLATYKKKTAALFNASLLSASVIAKFTDHHLIEEVATHLGLAFQLLDDSKDQDGLVDMIGAEQTQNLARDHYEKALKAMDFLPNPAKHLRELACAMFISLNPSKQKEGAI